MNILINDDFDEDEMDYNPYLNKAYERLKKKHGKTKAKRLLTVVLCEEIFDVLKE